MVKKTLPAAILAALMSASAGADMHNAEAGMLAGKPKPNSFWWPDQLNLQPLRDHAIESNPYGDDFDYAEAFAQVDFEQLKADLRDVMTDSQD